MAESGGLRNSACIVNCLKETEFQIVHSLIEELTGDKFSSQDVERGSVCWSVNNKYYTASIELFVEPSSKDWCPGRDYQALILLCDLDHADVLDTLNSSWTKIRDSDHTQPEVRVVVGVATCDTPTVEVLKWCVCEGMELVEWERGGSPQIQDTDSDDGLPPEAVGVARLSETLQAHRWPQVTMKGRDPTTPQAAVEVTSLEEGFKELGASTAAATVSEEAVRGKLDNMLLNDEQLASLNEIDPGGENFEELFSRFAQMKQHAESLPHEERKVYAEKVVMAFWNAMGGDQEEVNTDQN